MYIPIPVSVRSPLELPISSTKHPILATDGNNTILQLTLPFILCPMDLFIHTQHDTFIYSVILVFIFTKLGIEI
jgi:hypothetical protein